MSLIGPRIDAIVTLGKDGRHHVAYRDEDGHLLAESPPRGHATPEEAEDVAHQVRRGRIVVVRGRDGR